jgi:hypothetical protein
MYIWQKPTPHGSTALWMETARNRVGIVCRSLVGGFRGVPYEPGFGWSRSDFWPSPAVSLGHGGVATADVPGRRVRYGGTRRALLSYRAREQAASQRRNGPRSLPMRAGREGTGPGRSRCAPASNRPECTLPRISGFPSRKGAGCHFRGPSGPTRAHVGRHGNPRPSTTKLRQTNAYICVGRDVLP